MNFEGIHAAVAAAREEVHRRIPGCVVDVNDEDDRARATIVVSDAARTHIAPALPPRVFFTVEPRSSDEGFAVAVVIYDDDGGRSNFVAKFDFKHAGRFVADETSPPWKRSLSL